jgi:methionine sulfoxide reductase heme-binding subunit
MSIHAALTNKWSKVAAFGLSLVPLLLLGWRGLHQELGANPIEFITHSTGDWTLRFLLITLSITPLRKLTNQAALIRFRRMAGLFTFFYGSLHLVTYVWLDKFFDVGDMVKDIAKRPFITVGFTAFVLMVPLAATSTAGWIRRLGGRRWRQVHRLIYFSGVAAVVHYYWLVKSDVRLPLLYAGILSLLLLYRLGAWLRKAHLQRLSALAPYRPDPRSSTVGNVPPSLR